MHLKYPLHVMKMGEDYGAVPVGSGDLTWTHRGRFSVLAPAKPNQAESLLPVIQPATAN